MLIVILPCDCMTKRRLPVSIRKPHRQLTGLREDLFDAVTAGRRSIAMNEQTIYSYKLLYRFRWRLFGHLGQIAMLLASLYLLASRLQMPFHELIPSLSIVAVVPILQFMLFRLYTYFRSLPAALSADMLFSAWWGAGTVFPLSLTLFRGAELTVSIGSLLITAAVYVWLPAAYGVALLAGTAALALPRILVLFASLGQPKHCRVKYETRGVAFLLTDG
jgi:hypothetical protein